MYRCVSKDFVLYWMVRQADLRFVLFKGVSRTPSSGSGPLSGTDEINESKVQLNGLLSGYCLCSPLRLGLILVGRARFVTAPADGPVNDCVASVETLTPPVVISFILVSSNVIAEVHLNR